MQEECTFTPQISTTSQKYKAHYDFSNPDKCFEQIKDDLEQKQQELDTVRQAKDAEAELLTMKAVQELKRTKFDQSLLYKKVDVPGLDAVKQRVEMAEKQKRELEERKQKVFGLKEGKRTVTVPEPFNLRCSEQSKQTKRKTDSELITPVSLGVREMVDEMLRLGI